MEVSQELTRSLGRMPLPPPDECAQCGAPVPLRAKACPSCGADERTGWRETDIYDGLDLPASAFADEAESPADARRAPPRVNGFAWYWWAAGALLLVLLIAGALGLR